MNAGVGCRTKVYKATHKLKLASGMSDEEAKVEAREAYKEAVKLWVADMITQLVLSKAW